MLKKRRIISLFSGAGGLDLGFKKAGFETVWANDSDKSVFKTFTNYFKNTKFDQRSILKVPISEIPSKNVIGVIGGPPCQSWSIAGAKRGIKDERGLLFNEYIKVIKALKPLFFVAENVAGLTNKRNEEAFTAIKKKFNSLGYYVSTQLLNASDYGIPQDRKRVFIVGYNKKYFKQKFEFPPPLKTKKITLQESIGKLQAYKIGSIQIKNHDVSNVGFSYIYMSRNRIRNWNEQSYTILASERHIPLHPSSPKMIKVKKDVMRFIQNKTTKYRRLSVRECANIQTFPSNFKFIYNHVSQGYKMVGNAVPVKLAEVIAKKIAVDLKLKKPVI
jgi:DNA (cytosine-5)-methyltransferase 1